MNILVIDGQGGNIGCQLVKVIKEIISKDGCYEKIII